MEQAKEIIQRLPPHNLEAERALLGAILIEGDLLTEIMPLVKPEDFYATAHQRIFEACIELFDDGKRVDALLIQEQLSRRGELERVGGEPYLAQLAGMVPSAAGAEDYARIVSDKAVTRNLIHVCTSIQTSAYGGTTAGEELLDWAENEIFALSRGAADADTVNIAPIINEAFEEIQALIDNGGALSGLSTGFLDLDEKTSGFGPGDLVIIAGRPSMGKTTFSNCIVDHVAVVERKPVAYFSLEVSSRHLVRNMLCSRARVQVQRVLRGLIDQQETQQLTDAASELMVGKIFIDDSTASNIIQVRAKARRVKQRHGLGLAVVDYLQLMETGRAENRQQEIAQISRGLKAMARELEIPVIAISQLNRSVDTREDRRPRMSDLRESGALEQDADLILFLYRESQYKPDADPTEAELIIAKQRNGPTGNIPLRFFGDEMRFANYSYGGEEGF